MLLQPTLVQIQVCKCIQNAVKVYVCCLLLAVDVCSIRQAHTKSIKNAGPQGNKVRRGITDQGCNVGHSTSCWRVCVITTFRVAQ